MTTQAAPPSHHSELISTTPERTDRKIMRRSLLVVLAIVLGLGISICHVALTTAGHPILSVLLFAAMTLIVAALFSRFSPERHLVYAWSLSLPSVILAFAYGAIAPDVVRGPLWYLAPAVWLVTALQGAVLGRRAASRLTATRALSGDREPPSAAA